jgi:ornithine cyclodeaminase/alanine dehydrogenase-like protein (mu-crystallin family)
VHRRARNRRHGRLNLAPVHTAGAFILVLDEAAVRRHLNFPELITALAPALAAFSAGAAVQPVRLVMPVADHRGYFGAMPAYTGALGAKLVTFYPENRDVPTHHALIALFRPETGEPVAVMDGRLITEFRTAAVSAIATDLLARRDAATLCLLGAGVQAASHLEALRLVRPFTEVRVWSPRHAAEFAARYGVTAAASAEAAVRGADVVVVATSSPVPVLDGGWLAAGAHVNAIGACRPDWRELDDATLNRARLVVDSRAAALVESGDVMAAPGIAAELGAVIADPSLGRTDSRQVTLFKSLGMAVEDVVAADLVYRAARSFSKEVGPP